MTKNRFTVGLAWELRNVFRFPFPEIMLALFTFITFSPRESSLSSSIPMESLIWSEITRMLTVYTFRASASFSYTSYLPMSLLTSILATVLFAHEIENSLLKVHLSHPISKRDVFLSKFISCFLVAFLTFTTSLLVYIFLSTPENFFNALASPDLISKMLLLSSIETLFSVSVAVSFSIYSGRAAISLFGSFATFYFIQLLYESANLAFLPPGSFLDLSLFLFSTTTLKLSEIINLSVIPVASIVLIVFSYVYFSRRMEIS